MTHREWKHYVDTGKVPLYFLKEVVDIIKRGGKLTDKHIAVYQSHGQVIEALLK